MTFDLPTLVSTRLNICRQCEHYLPAGESSGKCNYLIQKTLKKGNLDHPLGISNPRSRCPLKTGRKWNSIMSYHTWYIDHFLTRLDDEQKHSLNKNGVQWLQPIGVVNLIYKRFSEGYGQSPPPRRSELLAELTDLMKTHNGYRYIEANRLKVSYDLGTVE